MSTSAHNKDTQPLETLPVLTEYTEEEKRIAELQTGFETRLRKSAYYIVESIKSTGMSCHPVYGP